MKKTVTILFILILNSCIGLKHSSPIEIDLAIENVSIFNSKTKEILENKTILIRGDKISAIIENGNQKYLAKKTIKGNGKIVVPGFIDTHVHLTQIFRNGVDAAPDFIDDSLRHVLAQQYLQYGTTTILDLGQPEKWLDVSIQWQNSPSHLYPNIYNAGGALISDYDKKPDLNHVEIYNKQHAKEKISNYSSKGIKHIKLYSFLNEMDLINVTEEAKSHNIKVFGHLDRGEVNISKAMKLGVQNFEHFFTVINAVLSDSDHWIKLNEKYNLKRNRSIDEWTARMLLYFDYVESNPDLVARLDNLLAKMAENEVNISTTISQFASVSEQSDFFSSFVNFPLRKGPFFPNYTNVEKSTLDKAFQIMMSYLKKANEKGVKIRIGTDCRFGGAALFNELILMAKAGIPVGDILQMATWNGAEAMGISNQRGIIDIGTIADLQIFDNNPFDDYKNFASTKMIIKDGIIFNPKKNLTIDVVEKVINDGVEKTIKWYESIPKSENYYPYHEIELNEAANELWKLDKTLDALNILRYCHSKFENAGNQFNNLNEKQWNEMGYYYLGKKDISRAIEIFKFNVDLFPESWNAYDSLGEAYLLANNKELAKKNYKKSVQINPDNEYGIEALKRIEKQ